MKSPYPSPKTAPGYQGQPQPGSPTFTEGWALIEAARRMAEAVQSGPPDAPETRKAMRAALKLNWRLWTVFQANLTTDENAVPADIRMNMLTLCKFIDKHTVQSMADPTPERVVVLIDINRNIASGLLEGLKADSERAGANAADTTEQQDGDAPPPGTNVKIEA